MGDGTGSRRESKVGLFSGVSREPSNTAIMLKLGPPLTGCVLQQSYVDAVLAAFFKKHPRSGFSVDPIFAKIADMDLGTVTTEVLVDRNTTTKYAKEDPAPVKLGALLRYELYASPGANDRAGANQGQGALFYFGAIGMVITTVYGVFAGLCVAANEAHASSKAFLSLGEADLLFLGLMLLAYCYNAWSEKKGVAKDANDLAALINNGPSPQQTGSMPSPAALVKAD